LRWGGIFINNLLQISYWMCRWKNYENRSIFSKDMDKSTVCYFFWDTVYIQSTSFPTLLVCRTSATIKTRTQDN